jgi:hypothetical protein
MSNETILPPNISSGSDASVASSIDQSTDSDSTSTNSNNQNQNSGPPRQPHVVDFRQISEDDDDDVDDDDDNDGTTGSVLSCDTIIEMDDDNGSIASWNLLPLLELETADPNNDDDEDDE